MFEDWLIILPSYPLAVEVTSLNIKIGECKSSYGGFLLKSKVDIQ